MKKTIFVILISGILAVFALLGCNNSGAVKLTAPNNFRMENEIIFWDEVEHADLYIVTFLGEETETEEEQFELPDELQAGKYKIGVVAISNEKYLDSDIAVYNFKIEEKVIVMNYDAPLSYKLLEDRSGYEVHRKNADPNKGMEGVVVIPDFYKGLPVKRIADNAFNLFILGGPPTPNTVTTGFVLPQYLESIGEDAFCDCEMLEGIEIPETVSTIEEGAFGACVNLKKIKLPQMLKSISDSMLSSSAIKEIELPPTLESIGRSAFDSCKFLKTIDIPDTVKKIGAYAFMGCKSLKEVKFPSKLEILGDKVFDNTAWYDAQPNGYVIINGDFLYKYKGETPKSLELPMSIKYIAGGAFYGCKTLRSITFGSNIRLYGTDAFTYCDSLSTVNYTGDIADWCNIEFIEEYSNPLSRGARLYIGGQFLTDLVIPNDMTEIKPYAFYGYKYLQSLTISSGVTKIGDYTFKDCNKLIEINNLSALDIGAGEQTHGFAARYALHIYNSNNGETSNIDRREDGYIFYKDTDKNYLVGYFGEETDLILPDYNDGERFDIYKYAFSYNDNLTSVTIGESVRMIYPYAFAYCNGLKGVIFKNAVGWQASFGSNMANADDITVTDPAQNAKYLIGAYCSYYWGQK